MDMKKSTTENTEKNITEEYFWCWNANPDPMDESIDPDWRGYDQATNKLIEENYLKGVFLMEIGIGAHVYCVDLQQRYQYLQNDSFRCRPITRVPKKEYIRFIKVKDSESSTGNSSNKSNKDTKDNNKPQIKLKVCELFGYPEDNEGYIFDAAENPLFSTDVIISRKLYRILRDNFYNQVTLKDSEEVISVLQSEISREQERYIALYSNKQKVNTLDKIKIPNFIKRAEDYWLKVSEKPNFSFEEKLVYLYTLKGYISYSLESALANFYSFSTMLYLYYTLLQPSISFVAQKYNAKYAPKCVSKNAKGEDYYVFYYATQVKEKYVADNILEVKKTTGNSLNIYHEFFLASYDKQVAKAMLGDSGEIAEIGEIAVGYVPVIYVIQIKKKLADKNLGLFCFVEEISERPQRKEVLISSSVILKTEKIEKHESGSHFEYVLEFEEGIYY